MAAVIGRKSKDPEIDGVDVRLIDMTPDLAEDLLDQNTNNRKFKQKYVEEYVQALLIGDWQFNGDPIRVATSGRLLDGQHRLMAIAESGVTVPTVLITGLPDRAQMTMDAGAKRSYADHLQLNGEGDPNSLGAAVASYANYRTHIGKQAWPPTGRQRLSIAQLDRVLGENPGLREATAISGTLYKKLRLSRPAISLAYYVQSGLNQEDCDFFWERIINGDGLSVEDHTQPILKLREFILEKHKHMEDHRKLAPCAAAIFKTWNAYREGRSIATAVVRLGGSKPERFPWPK